MGMSDNLFQRAVEESLMKARNIGGMTGLRESISNSVPWLDQILRASPHIKQQIIQRLTSMGMPIKDAIMQAQIAIENGGVALENAGVPWGMQAGGAVSSAIPPVLAAGVGGAGGYGLGRAIGHIPTGGGMNYDDRVQNSMMNFMNQGPTEDPGIRMQDPNRTAPWVEEVQPPATAQDAEVAKYEASIAQSTAKKKKAEMEMEQYGGLTRGEYRRRRLTPRKQGQTKRRYNEYRGFQPTKSSDNFA